MRILSVDGAPISNSIMFAHQYINAAASGMVGGGGEYGWIAGGMNAKYHAFHNNHFVICCEQKEPTNKQHASCHHPQQPNENDCTKTATFRENMQQNSEKNNNCHGRTHPE